MAHFCSPDVRNSTFLFYPHFKGRPKYPTLLLFCLKWPKSYIQPLSKFCRIMKRHIVNLAHYITTLYNVTFQFLKIHCIRIFCIWNNPSMFWTWRLMQICCFHLTIYIIWWLCEFSFLGMCFRCRKMQQYLWHSRWWPNIWQITKDVTQCLV